MARTPYGEGTGYRIATVLFIVLALFLIFGGSYATAAHLLTPGTIHYRCSDFTSYDDALAKYRDGASYLDGGGMAGIPCDALYHKKYH